MLNSERTICTEAFWQIFLCFGGHKIVIFLALMAIHTKMRVAPTEIGSHRAAKLALVHHVFFAMNLAFRCANSR